MPQEEYIFIHQIAFQKTYPEARISFIASFYVREDVRVYLNEIVESLEPQFFLPYF